MGMGSDHVKYIWLCMHIHKHIYTCVYSFQTINHQQIEEKHKKNSVIQIKRKKRCFSRMFQVNFFSTH